MPWRRLSCRSSRTSTLRITSGPPLCDHQGIPLSGAENTKLCLKCHKPVEKNGGYNLVACICGQAFCWLCGGATGRYHTWLSISGHSCGRFTEDQSKRTERARRDLYRYSALLQ